MTDNNRFDVVFRGDIAPGETLPVVRQRLGELFRLDETRLAQLFSGRPVVVKRGLTAEEGERYRQTLERAGALVTLRAASPESASQESPAASVAPATGRSEPDVAPVGADVLRPEERRSVEAPEFDLDHLSVAEAGSDVLRPEERRTVQAPELDLSHLSVASAAPPQAG